MTGRLYIVATPIGNLEDITIRALRILRESDLIACEDTRRTRKLLTHYGIKAKVISYHEHNERERTPELIERLEGGSNIALVSDAGSPLISDPGYRVVTESIARGIDVVPIPGPSAVIAALNGAGLSTAEFTFAGFLPRGGAARKTRLGELASYRSTLVLFEAPHRLASTLADCLAVLGDRPACVARELTKVHEEFRRGTISQLIASLGDSTVQGEVVLLIAPPADDNRVLPVPDSLIFEVEELMRSEGLDRKAALKRVARAHGLTRGEAYKRMLAERNDSNG